MLNKLKLIVREEVDERFIQNQQRLREVRESKRNRSQSTTKSKESYTKFNGVRPPLNFRQRKFDSLDQWVSSQDPRINSESQKELLMDSNLFSNNKDKEDFRDTHRDLERAADPPTREMPSLLIS